VTSRDRPGLYAERAASGAPDAQQTADRFHLIVNLSAAIELALEERSRLLALPALEAPAEVEIDSGVFRQTIAATNIADAATGASPGALSRGGETPQRWKLAGCNQPNLAHSQGRQYGDGCQSGHFPERKPPTRKPAKVQEFANCLQQRWKEGCHNATRLFEEIRKKGYRGRRGMVAHFVSG
jgi:hypothetical protein